MMSRMLLWLLCRVESVAAVGPGCTRRSVCPGVDTLTLPLRLRAQRSEVRSPPDQCALSLSVSSQVEVKGVVGDDVLLPCSYPDSSSHLRAQRVLEEPGRADGSGHRRAPRTSRTRTRSSEDEHGNFSVVLQDVQQLDGGLYECHMVVDIRQRVRLHVTEEGGRRPSLVPDLQLLSPNTGDSPPGFQVNLSLSSSAVDIWGQPPSTCPCSSSSSSSSPHPLNQRAPLMMH
ncbi:hypothetical protein INR49_022805 [Caranx melampygus]|nr:hypothetical protein INR49_022805 [Caranx melampygus]